MNVFVFEKETLRYLGAKDACDFLSIGSGKKIFFFPKKILPPQLITGGLHESGIR